MTMIKKTLRFLRESSRKKIHSYTLKKTTLYQISLEQKLFTLTFLINPYYLCIAFKTDLMIKT
jgi:hypothetical protein